MTVSLLLHDAMISKSLCTSACGLARREGLAAFRNRSQELSCFYRHPHQRQYATYAGRAFKDSTRSKKFLYIAGGTLAVGAGAIAVSEDARHLYLAAQRTGRVVTTLALNINEYVRSVQYLSVPDCSRSLQLSSNPKAKAPRSQGLRCHSQSMPQALR